MSLHVLVISDNGAFAAYLCELLVAAGHAATSVPEGKESWPAIRRAKPDLIVVAVEAAKIAALAVEQRLHAPEGFRTVPLIVISECLKLEPELLHVFDFLPKPLDVQRLLHDVAAVAKKPAKAKRHELLTDRQHQELSTYIVSRTGLDFQTRNHSALARAVGKRISTLHLDSCADYLAYLKRHGQNRHELQKLLQFLTVGETCFFRYPCQFDALKELLSQKSHCPTQPIRIWSAGCSTGEEPYSIAITVMEALPDWRDRDIKIIATDINERSIKSAQHGVYTNWTFRMTDQGRKKRYFQPEGKALAIRDEVKQLVEFRHQNLYEAFGPNPGGELQDLDAIFCRNVLIYFSLEAAAGLMSNFSAALKASGRLFLGHAEPLLQSLPELTIKRQGKSFYYVKGEPTQPTTPDFGLQPGPAAVPRSSLSVRQKPTSAANLKSAQRLFDTQQFDAAYRLLETLPADSAKDADALILKGFILAKRGLLREAQESCRLAIKLNDLLSAGYFLNGMVLDACGLPLEAADEYRKALLLDHDFVMPRFYLGMLHQKAGRAADAVREIRNSINILSACLDPGVVPYSGGLDRAACLAQLEKARAQLATQGRLPVDNPLDWKRTKES
jgi:chemotaxis protein methyltransferase CheR